MGASIEILATGDLGPCRADPGSIFSHAKARLDAAALVIGQLEPVLTARGTPMPQARLAMRSPPQTAAAIRDAGFDIVSFASNHCMDWGSEGLLDTCAALRDAGLEVVGAGANIAAARAPVVTQLGDTKVAVLAFNSVLPMGYWAESARAGCAPVRAWTIQEQIEHDQPGTPSRTHSFAHRDDLAQLIGAIAEAKALADVVLLSMHWGIHFVPVSIAHYQREIAHAAIDAGVDAVIGHHPHIIKGIETYRGKAIFYSLGNFAIDPPTAFDPDLRSKRSHREITALNPDWEESHGHVRLKDSAMALVARLEIQNRKLTHVGALPVYIDADSRPQFVAAGDPSFTKIAEFLRSSTQQAELNGQFAADGNALRVLT